MEIGVVIVGDELLSGKREDKHLNHVMTCLKSRCLSISWARILPDNLDILVDNYKQTFQTQAIVFSFGGIGATPDDMTRQAVALAHNKSLVRHPDAVKAIEAKFGEKAYPQRILLAELPEDSRIIPNPYNNIPGFSLYKHHFFPGFPIMAWPMLDWVLTEEYPDLQAVNLIEYAVKLYGISEGQLFVFMQEITTQYPSLKLFSLPHITKDDQRELELGVKGEAKEAYLAITMIKSYLQQQGWQFEEVIAV